MTPETKVLIDTCYKICDTMRVTCTTGQQDNTGLWCLIVIWLLLLWAWLSALEKRKKL